MKKIVFGLLLAVVSTLAFSQSYTQASYRSYGNVNEGVVINVRPVSIEGQAGYVGAATGAAIGAAIGTNIGQGNGRILATTLAGVLGGVVGREAERKATGDYGQEIIVRTKNGQLLSLVNSGTNLAIGQPVFLIQGGDGVRAVPVTSM